jgi:hypothetical protein
MIKFGERDVMIRMTKGWKLEIKKIGEIFKKFSWFKIF